MGKDFWLNYLWQKHELSLQILLFLHLQEIHWLYKHC